MEQVSNASTLEQIAQALSDTEEELRRAIHSRAVVLEKNNDLAVAMVRLELSKKELATPIIKARDIVRNLELDIKGLTRKFWNKKNVKWVGKE